MNKSPKFKISTDFLLKYALELLKMDRKNLEQQLHQHLGLKNAQHMGTLHIDYPATGDIEQQPPQQNHSTDHIYSTDKWLIKTTRYNKIKSVEKKPYTQQKQENKPKITIKKTRKIVR